MPAGIRIDPAPGGTAVGGEPPPRFETKPTRERIDGCRHDGRSSPASVWGPGLAGGTERRSFTLSFVREHRQGDLDPFEPMIATEYVEALAGRDG